jgi:hypothetical protein
VAARVILALAVPVAAYAAQDSAQLIDGAALNPVVGNLIGASSPGRRYGYRSGGHHLAGGGTRALVRIGTLWPDARTD